jgi:exo-beta-1,3-glucanase (GH17 family)
VNTNPTVTSALRSLGRIASCAAALALAACGQNWQDKPGYVTVGGDVAGLTGTVVLQNNAQDDLSVTANGSFKFALQIANGANYAVTIKKQPVNQVCTVTSGTGTAMDNVHSVHVACTSYVRIGGTLSGLTGTVILQNNGGDTLATTANGSFTFPTAIAPGSSYAVTAATPPPGEICSVANAIGVAAADVNDVAIVCEPFVLRPLPPSYLTGKAVNYGPYRTLDKQTPTDAQLLEDLDLMEAAGFTLVRMFGADPLHEHIVNLAAQHNPALSFQIGIDLKGLATASACTGTAEQNSYNLGQIATAASIANNPAYGNVATVSVGNEPSFFSKYMPANCLAGYVALLRHQITQPVTVEDDYTFYAGQTTAGTDRIAEKPDALLQVVDFVAIHVYPFSNPGIWNWQQGTASALMTAAFSEDQHMYNSVASYLYRDATGRTVSIGATLPITIGETGWKATPTYLKSPLEAVANPAIANPVNAKWYYDLVSTWAGSAGGPVAVVYFEAFDEPWKGADDGWGLWDVTRAPLYALCGTPVPNAPACTNPVYQGAGYYH